MKLSAVVATCLVHSCLSVPFWMERVFGGLDSRNGNLRLLSDAEGHAVWADPEDWILQGKKFIDLTDHQDLGQDSDLIESLVSGAIDIPDKVTHQDEVKALLKSYPFSLDRMRERLTELTSFENRHYRSKTGVDSSKWVEAQLKAVARETGAPVTFRRFDHSFPQFSLIARLEPSNSVKSRRVTSDHSKVPIVVVSAHYDTVKGWFDSRRPGADDDGSGTVTVMEIFTLMCEAHRDGELNLSHPIEFHWYAGEEAGLLGSQDVVAAYKRDRVPVMAAIHFDMTGYRGKTDAIGIITDNVNPQLTGFMRKVMQEYTGRSIVESKCGYGCSDHASWNKAGYKSAFPFEGHFKESSPYIHTSRDTVANIDFEHMSSFVITGMSFVLELLL
ncbi:hypothetical protein MP228_003559 [Amoeboaphelidium protococcarum]|nr:hypothetical protein MP228_003559 [Amoeboaphelidium protococcarum]